MPEGLQQHIVSIWDDEVNRSPKAKGSGFCIAAKLILTAWHVVKDLEIEKIHIGLIATTDKGGRVKQVHRIKGYDAAIIELHEPHQKPEIECDYNNAISELSEVELTAYHVDQGKPLKPLIKQLSNANKDDQHWHFDNYPAKGMSGGMVVSQGKAIGIIRAQSKDNNDGVFIPLHLFKKQITAWLPDRNQPQAPQQQDHYQITQKQDLLTQLEWLKEESKTQNFYTLLTQKYLQSKSTQANKLLNSLLIELHNNPSDFLEELRIVCKNHMQTLRDDIELLLLLLLSQLAPHEEWEPRTIHVLKVRKRVLIELKLASRYQLPVDLHKHESLGLRGKYALADELAMKEEGVEEAQYAQQCAKTVAYRLYKKFDDVKDLEKDELEDFDWEELNDRIISLRAKDFKQLHRFEINIKRKPSGNALHDPEVCKALLKLLPDLPIVHFGQGTEKNENLLNNKISLFYQKLNQAD